MFFIFILKAFLKRKKTKYQVNVCLEEEYLRQWYWL